MKLFTKRLEKEGDKIMVSTDPIVLNTLLDVPGNFAVEVNLGESFQTTFDGETLGNDQIPTGWTDQWESGGWDMVSSPTLLDSRAVQNLDASGSSIALAWTDIGQFGNVDVISAIRLNQNGNSSFALCGINLRLGGTSTATRTAYRFGFRRGGTLTSRVRIDKIVDGAGENGDLSGGDNIVDYPWVFGTWYLFRVQALNNSVKLKIWEQGEEEPSSWNIELIDSDPLSAGYVALGKANDNHNIYWDGVSVATNGAIPTNLWEA